MKDYDVAMASDQERNQHLATYKRIGNDPPTIPKSTMHAGLEDALTSRRDYEAKKKNPVSLFVEVFSGMYVFREEWSILDVDTEPLYAITCQKKSLKDKSYRMRMSSGEYSVPSRSVITFDSG